MIEFSAIISSSEPWKSNLAIIRSNVDLIIDGTKRESPNVGEYKKNMVRN